MKVFGSPRNVLLVWLAIVLARLSICSGAVAADNVSFSDAYKNGTVTTNAQEIEAQQAADQASRSKHFGEASAKYLAAAGHAYSTGDFERARPFFDKAFSAAAQLAPEEQKLMLQTLSTLVANNRADRNYDAYEYFAQQRLKLLQRDPHSNPDEKYYAAQTIALSCSQHKRFKEAESLLMDTLKDLEKIKPQPKTYGTCKATLARVFAEAGDSSEAQKYYTEALIIVRQMPGSNDYENVLRDYLWFLLKDKKFKEASPIGDEYFKYTISPEQARWRNRVSYAMIARMFAESDVNEADKYYRAAFENEMEGTKTAMNMGYGQTCSEWAEMLHKFGKTQDAIKVLQEGMAFCRSSKWPDAFERYMKQMVDPCESYMREIHQNKEADRLRESYEKEKTARTASVRGDRDKWLERASKDDQNPVEKVEALTELAYRAFDAKKCDEGLWWLKDAIATYEKNANNVKSERMYDFFFNITIRLKKCDNEKESPALLKRIILARMVHGFDDPANSQGGCTLGTSIHENALQDYIGVWRPEKNSLLESLLTEAKASGKPSNVIFFLNQKGVTVDENGLALLDEIEKWKAKENDPFLLFGSMLRTVDWSIALNHFDKAEAKWKEAYALAEQTKSQKLKRPIFALSRSLLFVGRSFAEKGQLQKASEVDKLAYRESLLESREYDSQEVTKAIYELAAKYHTSGDTAGGESLLKDVLALSRTERGNDSLPERMWLVKLAEFYATSVDKSKTKQACTTFLTSISKPGLTVSKVTIDEMELLAKCLQQQGFTSESTLITKKLEDLRSHQCDMTDSVKHMK